MKLLFLVVALSYSMFASATTYIDSSNCTSINSETEIADTAQQMRILFGMKKQGLITQEEFEKRKQWLIIGCAGSGGTILVDNTSVADELNFAGINFTHPISTKKVMASDLVNSDGSKYYPGHSWYPPPINIDTKASANIGGSDGCGSRGGPGYRLPNGKCASW